MAFVANHLSQAALSTVATAQVTGAASKTTQVCEIWLANIGTTARTVTLYTLGTAVTNMLLPIPVSASGGQILQSLKIILNAGEILYAKQDVGTDITMTTYGGAE